MHRVGSVFMRRLLLLSLLAVMVGLLASCSWFQSGPAPAESKPPSSAKHWQAAMDFKNAGNFAMAAVELEKAIRIDPNMYQAYYHLGLVYEDMGQNMQAMRVWRAGLEKARTGPDRLDYPRNKAMTEIQAARTALQEKMIAQAKPKMLPAPEPEPEPAPMPVAPPPSPSPSPKPQKKTASKQPAGKYGVLYASYLKESIALKTLGKLKARDLPAEVMKARVKNKEYHRVVVGCCTTKSVARKTLERMKKMGYKENMIVMKLRK